MNLGTTSTQIEMEGVQPSASQVPTVLQPELVTIMNFFHQDVDSDCYQDTHSRSHCKLPTHAEAWSRNEFNVMPI